MLATMAFKITITLWIVGLFAVGLDKIMDLDGRFKHWGEFWGFWLLVASITTLITLLLAVWSMQ